MVDIVLAWTDFVLDFSDALQDLPDSVYIVGGAVRDAILRRPIKDLDLVTVEKGIGLARRIANKFGGAFYPLDETRDVGRVILDTPNGRLVIDVSGLRAQDLSSDLLDRDFTVNAIAVDLKSDLKTLIDPLGGARDVIEKRLRRCSPGSISNDPIRTLRGIRQSVQFGLRISPETLDDIKSNIPRLTDSSPERIRDEFIKLLALPKVTAALRVADALGALNVIVPELIPQHGFKQSLPHIYDSWNHTLAVIDALSDILATISYTRTDDTAAQFNLGMIAVALDRYRSPISERMDRVITDDRPHRALLTLAALLHDIGKPMVNPVNDEQGRSHHPAHERLGAQAAEDRLAALKLSNAERKLVVSLIRHHTDRTLWGEALSPVQIYRYWRMMGDDGIDLIILTLANYLGMTGHTYDQDVWLHLIENARILLEAYYERRSELIDPPLLINGEGLMDALGLTPGPLIRSLLEAVREGQVSGEIHTLEDALFVARRFLNGHHAV